MKITTTHVYFYSKTVFSNWDRSDLLCPIHNIRFFSSEHAFMWYKAHFFNDIKKREQIRMCKHSSDAKNFGREVSNFNEALWNTVKLGFMTYVCYLKFRQVPERRQALLDTGSRTLVEASPVDLIWGVGLEEDDPLILDEKNWRGINLLGVSLMQVRKLLQ